MKPSSQAAEFKTAVQAATDAIGLQLSCPKGLFLRAQARLKAPFSGGVEVVTAVADLEAACAALEAMEGHPADSAAAAAGSEGLTLTHVRAVLARVRRQQRAQAQRDARSFGGVLHNPNRPAIVEPPSTAAAPPAERAEMKTKTHLVAELERLSILAKDMEAVGKLDEARGLLQAVERATAELEAIPAEKIDFRNPTKKMREDAIAMGYVMLSCGNV
jgi:hypothetical protein